MENWLLSPTQKLLCQTLSDQSIDERKPIAQKLIEDLGNDKTFALALSNEVAPQIGHAIMAAFGDGADPRWENVHTANENKIRAFLDELDAVAIQLDQVGIPLVALKNGGIARGIYPCTGCCPMGDLDVMIQKADFEQAHKVLQAAGFQFKFRSALETEDFAKAKAKGSAEYVKTLPNNEKLWFEMLWRPVDGRWIRPDQEPKVEELMVRSVPIPGTKVRLLAPEDNLLQVCLHTAKHTYVRAPGFRLHTDVDRIVRRQEIDWGIFLKRVQALQVKTAVYFSLVIPAAIFGTPIPVEVLESLRPTNWKERLLRNWLIRVGLFNPHEKKFSKPGYIVFNMLLYDDLKGLLRSIFPEKTWMQARYDFKSNWLLPFYHLRRLVDLIFRRVNT